MKRYLLTILALCFILPSFAKADITTGLVAHWKLDEGSGSTAVDSSSSGNDLTESGSPTYVTGKIGPFALSLASASSQYASKSSPTGFNIQDNTPSSFSAWIKTTDTGANVISATWDLGTDAGYRFAVGGVNQGDVSILYINSGGTSYRQAYENSVLVNDGNWHLVTTTYDGSGSATGFQIYVDGSPITTFIDHNTAPGTLGNATLYMGRIGGGIPQFFNGTLDDVCVYTRALSAADVVELYASPTGCSTSVAPLFTSFIAKLGTAFNVMLGTGIKTN